VTERQAAALATVNLGRVNRSRTGGRRAALALAIGLPVSAILLWLAARHADLGAVGDTLAAADPALVALTVICMGVIYALQAERWRGIARTEAVPWIRMLELVLGGVACNNVLPGRVGDLLRARWLAVTAQIPSGRAFASVILDRGTDLVVLLAFLLASLPAVASARWIDGVAVGGLLLVAVFVVLLAFARGYVRFRPRERRQRRSARRIVRDTLDALAEPVDPGRLAFALALSAGAWTAFAIGAWLVARAVGFELAFAECFFVTAVVNLGVAIPSSPGFIGTYQWLGVASLGLVGIGQEDALAFAILLHAAWYVPTTLLGGAALVRRGHGLVRGDVGTPLARQTGTRATPSSD
jgi:uncharacterized protein (TIRG00374 family)